MSKLTDFYDYGEIDQAIADILAEYDEASDENPPGGRASRRAAARGGLSVVPASHLPCFRQVGRHRLPKGAFVVERAIQPVPFELPRVAV